MRNKLNSVDFRPNEKRFDFAHFLFQTFNTYSGYQRKHCTDNNPMYEHRDR